MIGVLISLEFTFYSTLCIDSVLFVSLSHAASVTHVRILEILESF